MVRNVTAWTQLQTQLLGHGQMYVPVKLGFAALTAPV